MSASPTRPVPTQLFHFTRIDHLPTIIERGILSDNLAQAEGLLLKEAGNQGIKEDRRKREVPCGPGGHVADYVPFYYSPRSPMLYAIYIGNVPTFTDSCENLIFMVTSTQVLRDAGLSVLGSDRNARMDIAEFSDDDDEITEFTRWDVMQLRYWRDALDGGELRQAECLTLGHVPWTCIRKLGVKTQRMKNSVSEILDAMAPDHRPDVTIETGWYF